MHLCVNKMPPRQSCLAFKIIASTAVTEGNPHTVPRDRISTPSVVLGHTGRYSWLPEVLGSPAALILSSLPVISGGGRGESGDTVW